MYQPGSICGTGKSAIVDNFRLPERTSLPDTPRTTVTNTPNVWALNRRLGRELSLVTGCASSRGISK